MGTAFVHDVYEAPTVALHPAPVLYPACSLPSLWRTRKTRFSLDADAQSLPRDHQETSAAKLDLTGRALFVRQRQGAGWVVGSPLPLPPLPRQGALQLASHSLFPQLPGGWGWRGTFGLTFQVRCRGPERVSDLPKATQLELNGAQPSTHFRPWEPLQAGLGSVGSRQHRSLAGTWETPARARTGRPKGCGPCATHTSQACGPGEQQLHC